MASTGTPDAWWTATGVGTAAAAGRIERRLPADGAARPGMDVDHPAGAQVGDADDAALDGDDRAVAVVLRDPDRAVHRRGGEAALGAEAAVAAAEQPADGLAAGGGDRDGAVGLRGRALADGEVAALELELGDRARRAGLVEGEDGAR